MIETTKHPYELLVRWGEDGKLRAAHVGFALVTVEDGKQIGWTPQPVMPVDIGQGKGFPLAEILEQIHIDAISALDAAVSEKAVVEANLEQATTLAANLSEQLAAKTKELEKAKAA